MMELEAQPGVSWDDFAKALIVGPVTSALIQAALGTPDDHLPGYMERFWLKRPTDKDNLVLPKSPQEIRDNAIRIHHILKRDEDRHLHDHPWEFRSIILCGWYKEERMRPDGSIEIITRSAGDTYTCGMHDYHRIIEISHEPLYTMCILGKKQRGWGFFVDGKHVDSHEYLAY